MLYTTKGQKILPIEQLNILDNRQILLRDYRNKKIVAKKNLRLNTVKNDEILTLYYLRKINKCNTSILVIEEILNNVLKLMAL